MRPINTFRTLLICALAGLAGIVSHAPAYSTDNAPSPVRLRSRTMSPQPGVAAMLAGQAGAGSWHGLLQLTGSVDDGRRAALAQAGVSLHAYIPDNTWLATMPADPEQLRRLAGFVWAGTLAPADKLDPLLLDPAFVAGRDTGQGSMALWVQLFPDAVAAGEAALAAHALDGVRPVDGQHQYAVTVNLAAMSELAAEDAISWIAPAPGEPSISNAASRASSGADNLQVAPYGLNGAAVQVGVWDQNVVDAHPDFGSRLTVPLSGTPNQHASHVAGTVAGDGSNSQNQGFAPYEWRGYATQADIVSYSWSNPIANHNPALNTYGVDVSQNSWGFSSCSYFGRYIIYAPDYDDIITGLYGRRIPVIFSAGNTNGSCGVTYGSVMGGPSSAKNVITVGALDLQDNLAGYSAWGPTEDGRLKPEVVAVGYGQRSTCLNGTYCTYVGTSQAAPAVSGTAALIRQQYDSVCTGNVSQGLEPLPSTYRALIVHGAVDMDDPSSGALNRGPDFASGYGRLSARNAVDLLPFHVEGSVAHGASQAYSITVNGQSQLKVTLVWDDEPGAYAAAVALVNDLDLEVVAPDGVTVYGPWKLNPTAGNQGSPATRPTWAAGGTPVRDNRNVIEQVLVDSPAPGAWTLRVVGSNVPVGPQRFSLVSEALTTSSCERTAEIDLVDIGRNGNDVALSWSHRLGNLAYEVWRGSSATVTPGQGDAARVGIVSAAGLAPDAAMSYTDAGVIGGAASSLYYTVRAVSGSTSLSSPSNRVGKVDTVLTTGGNWISVDVADSLTTAADLRDHIVANSSAAVAVSTIQKWNEGSQNFRLFSTTPFTFGNFGVDTGGSYFIATSVTGGSAVWTQVGQVSGNGLAAPFGGRSLNNPGGAGPSFHYGQVQSLPPNVNYVAWLGSAGAAPAEILTEDGFNSADGAGQGYQAGYWMLNLNNFAGTPNEGEAINLLFGGEGPQSGTIWRYDTSYSSASPSVDHGVVGVPTGGACPTMNGVGQFGGANNVYWSGPAGTYLVYRSQQASGADNGRSNGRYQYLATVVTTGPSGSYVDETAAASWYLVIPAKSGGGIDGCHSEEAGISAPTAIRLDHVQAAASPGPWALLLLMPALAAISLQRRLRRRDGPTA